jgi:HEPN domain-containing protein
MKAETREWMSKARADLATASREANVTEDANYDAVCFHSQQAAEKYLKASLVEAGVAFPRTHDLESLLDLCLPAHQSWERLRPDLQSLTSMGVEVRYPGTSADAEDARDALRIAELVRAAIHETQ